MTKTVQQIVKEYLSRQNNAKYDYNCIRIVSIPTTCWEDSVFYNVSNLKETDIGDARFKELQFDTTDETGTMHIFKIGKIVETSSFIEE